MMQKIILVVLCMAIGAAVGVGQLRNAWHAPLRVSEQGSILLVSSGDSLRRVAAQLHDTGVLEHPTLFVVYGRWTGVDKQIKPGEYQLKNGMAMNTLLDRLRQGAVVKYQVTFPEGITLAKTLEILSGQKKLKIVLSGTNDPRLLDMVKPRSKTEGLFYPDTYQYTLGDTDLGILQQAHARLISILDDEWAHRDQGLPYQSPYEALIMASIIERETGLAEERAQISGVFVRRMQRGMLLQTDPTVIYGLGSDFNGNLQRTHLNEEANPYNTYKHAGLPPTPIALPGRDAIHAALHPDTSETLYFVAVGDGSHRFSKTLDAHNEAVRAFQLRRDKSYRSQPRR